MISLKKLKLSLYLPVLAVATAEIAAAPVDLSPPRNALGVADENGHLRYVHRFGDLAFSDNFTIPLRFDFSSKRIVDGVKSDFGWHGWNCGAVESEAKFLEDGRILRIDLLCAKTMFLQRVEGEHGRYLTSDGTWTGTVEGDEVRVEREDGWSLAFRGGKVDHFQTEKGRMIRWERDESGKVIRVFEEGAGTPALEVEWDSGRAIGLALGGLHYQLEYRDDNLTAFKWKSLGGIERSLQCEQTLQSLFLNTSRAGRFRFQWDPENGIVRADGNNHYSIKRYKDGGRAFLILTEPSGVSMSYELGKSNGDTRRTLPDGGEIVVTRVISQGRDNGAVSKVEWVREGKPTEALLWNHFDEKGRIVRRLWWGDPRSRSGYSGGEVDAALLPERETLHPAENLSGGKALAMIEFEYTDDDKLLRTKVNGEPALELNYDPEGRPAMFVVNGRFSRTYEYREDGSTTETLAFPSVKEKPFWYLESDDKTVGPDLVLFSHEDEDGRLLERRFVDGRSLTVEYDASMRRVADRMTAPDGQTEIERVTYVYSPENGTAMQIREDFLTGRVDYADVNIHAIGRNPQGRRVPAESAVLRAGVSVR